MFFACRSPLIARMRSLAGYVADIKIAFHREPLRQSISVVARGALDRALQNMSLTGAPLNENKMSRPRVFISSTYFDFKNNPRGLGPLCEYNGL